MEAATEPEKDDHRPVTFVDNQIHCRTIDRVLNQQVNALPSESNEIQSEPSTTLTVDDIQSKSSLQNYEKTSTEESNIQILKQQLLSLNEPVSP